MRATMVLGLASVFACGGAYEPPPPPADAVASCVIADDTTTFSTRWLDANGRTIRIDQVFGSYELRYDDAGRIIDVDGESNNKLLDTFRTTYQYEPDRITKVGPGTSLTTMDLVDGRVTHVEGPDGNVDYKYDAAGRLAERTDGEPVRFTYDATDRLVHVERTTATFDLTYDVDTPQQRQITIVVQSEFPHRVRWTYDFDDQHRITREAYGDPDFESPPDVATFTYADGEIAATSRDRTIRATGTCELPAVITGPIPPLPILFLPQYAQLTTRPEQGFAALVR